MYKESMLKSCCGIRYKLVITDLNMPVMNGYEASQEIKSFNKQMNSLSEPGLGFNVGNIDTPIVAFSAYLIDGDLKKLFEYGLCNTLPKPFYKKDLINILNLHYF